MEEFIERVKYSVVEIPDDDESLEKFRDLIIEKGIEGLFSYDDTFVGHDKVSSGYFHYDEDIKGFYLSKKHDGKNIIELKDLF